MKVETRLAYEVEDDLRNKLGHIKKRRRSLGERWAPAWWCKLFHRKDHVCWDEVFKKESGWDPPGRACWFCEKCHRSWSTKELRPLNAEPWEAFIWDGFMKPCRKDEDDA
jgi:hypothetical protein